jgi:hypothetical protein
MHYHTAYLNYLLALFCQVPVDRVYVHRCLPGVDTGICYQAILDAFSTKQRASYGRIMVVNPLHSQLPKLAVLFQATCNKFDAGFVREQWKFVAQLWDQHLLSALGPLIGHASDGDARRRHLQMEDYTSAKATPYTLPDAPGFLFSALHIPATGKPTCGARLPTYSVTLKVVMQPLL